MLFSPIKYNSSILFLPQNGSESLTSTSLTGLASIAGIDLPNHHLRLYLLIYIQKFYLVHQ